VSWDERRNVDTSRYNVVRRPGETDLQRAIQFSEEHREIHLRWIDWNRKHPHQRSVTAGGVRHNEIAVRRYNVILKALRAKDQA
jgi:hypothetical protein